MYLASSLQGSFEALRSMNAVTHFTRYTVAHAHLGLYGFVSMVFFGDLLRGAASPAATGLAAPDRRPLLARRDRHRDLLVSLTIGGWLQGSAMLDESRGFMESVAPPCLISGGAAWAAPLMALGHVVFAAHFARLLIGERRRAQGTASPFEDCDGSPVMHSETRLVLGGLTTLAVATAALVVLPYFTVPRQRGGAGSRALHRNPAPRGELNTYLMAAYCYSQQPARRHSHPTPNVAGARYRRRRLCLRRPALLGTMRTGPDLMNIGARQPSDQWHLGHLYQPRLCAEQHHAGLSFLFEIRDKAEAGETVVTLPPGFAPKAGRGRTPRGTRAGELPEIARPQLSGGRGRNELSTRDRDEQSRHPCRSSGARTPTRKHAPRRSLARCWRSRRRWPHSASTISPTPIWARRRPGVTGAASPNFAGDKPVAGANSTAGAIYAARCTACHQATGQGLPGVFSAAGRLQGGWPANPARSRQYCCMASAWHDQGQWTVLPGRDAGLPALRSAMPRSPQC